MEEILSNDKYNETIFKNPFINFKNKLISLCYLSTIVYYYEDNKDIIDDLLSKYDIINHYTEVDYKNNTVYGIYSKKNNMIISFKGTSHIYDIFSYINFKQIDDNYNIPGKMHAGYYNNILGNKLCDNILKIIINNINSSIENIYITGHSMGGGIATIFYSFMKNNTSLNKNIKLVTFGSPKVGDKEFRNYLYNYKDDIIRVINGKDIITYLPLFFKYKHIKKSKQIKKDISYFELWNISDHYLINYYNTLINLT